MRLLTGEEVETALKALRKQQDNDDQEEAHSEADDIISDLLYQIGYKEIAEAYRKVPKWFDRGPKEPDASLI